MKKLIALVMCVMMLATLAVGTSAAGEILFTDDFTNGFSPNNWITDGNMFFLDEMTDATNPCLAAYSDGVVSQMEFRSEINGDPKWFTNFSFSTRVQIRDFDSDGDHGAGLWWRDDFGHAPNDEDLGYELGEVWTVMVDADNMIVKLLVEGEETNRAEAPVSGVEVGGDWFTLGWKIVPGKMSVYINNEKLIDYASDEIAATRPSPILLINSNCYVAFDDIIAATVDYDLFGDEGAGSVTDTPANSTEGGDTPADNNNNNADNNADAGNNNADNNNDANNSADTSSATSRVESSVVTNDKGETSIVTNIITDPAPADTNTGKPAGGSSTSTGDSTFVVIAVMVAVLGCAVVVKKVKA